MSDLVTDLLREMERRTLAPNHRPEGKPQLGIPEIDREHEKLALRLVQLESLSFDARDEDAFTDLLSRLGRELAAHFESEEKFMRGCGLPEAELRSHLQAHDQILDQFARYNLDRMRGVRQRRAETLAMIGHWIQDHSLEYDLMLRDYTAQPVV